MTALHVRGQRSTARQELRFSLLLLLLLLAITPCKPMPLNPPRYDPLALKALYPARKLLRNVVTAERCQTMRKGVPGRGTSKQDAVLLDHVKVQPTTTPSTTKLLCVSYTYV